MRLLRVASRKVTGLMVLSLVGLGREMAGIATYAFLIMLGIGILMSAIE